MTVPPVHGRAGYAYAPDVDAPPPVPWSRGAENLGALIEACRGDGPLYIASNRGPNEYELRQGRWVVKPARGGLVSLLRPVFRQPSALWLACAMSDAERDFVRQAGMGTTVGDQASRLARMRYVVATSEDFRQYYGLIANETFWPIQHGLWGTHRDHRIERRHYLAWEAYRRINGLFARAIAEDCSEGPAVLVQDYHLYLLPGRLRRLMPRTRVLHFTHIPWPGLNGWDALPGEFFREIMTSLCAADVLGFQTQRDVTQFLDCAEAMLGPRAVSRQDCVVAADGRRTMVRAYPAAPDFREVAGAVRREGSRETANILPRLGEKTILRVDRLDPSKNQLLGFEAFSLLLEDEPERRRDTRFLALLIPSRTDLTMYRDYRDAVYRLVGEINARFDDCDAPPISVLYMNDRRQALAAMRRCDVLLANSVADGMNLVVKETLIVNERGAVPVVGQGAGAARELSPWILPVAAHDLWGTARALSRALMLPEDERMARQAAAREYLRQHDQRHWLTTQLTDLREATRER